MEKTVNYFRGRQAIVLQVQKNVNTGIHGILRLNRYSNIISHNNCT